MRDPNRIKTILAELETLWLKNPDLRLGQLLVFITGHTSDFFYYEDDDLLAALRSGLY